MKSPFKKKWSFFPILLFTFCLFITPKDGNGQVNDGRCIINPIACECICEDPRRNYNHEGKCVEVAQNEFICYCHANWTDKGSVNAYTYCFIEELGFAGEEKSSEPIELTEDQINSIPFLTVVSSYTESPGCSVYAGKKPLILEVRKDKKTKAKSSAMALCEDGCDDKPMQWAFKQVDPEHPQKGFYVCSTGKKEECLCWDKENGLSLAEQPKEVKEAKEAKEAKGVMGMVEDEKSCMVWHVGVGEVKDKEVTGYRIISSTDIDYGLTVNEKGEVAVNQIFTMKEQEEGMLPSYDVSKEFQSVWKFDNCMEKPKEKEKVEKAADKVAPADKN